PSGGDLEWTRRCFRELADRRSFDRMWGWALHHYSSAPNGEAVAFDEPAWYDLLSSANRMESLITSQWQVMGESDREHRVKLVVDEWGAWHKMTTNVEPTHLFGPRDAEIAIRGAAVTAVRATTLAARDVHDHNTFEAPRSVEPATASVAVSASPFVYRFPAASVTKLEIAIGR